MPAPPHNSCLLYHPLILGFPQLLHKSLNIGIWSICGGQCKDIPIWNNMYIFNKVIRCLFHQNILCHRLPHAALSFRIWIIAALYIGRYGCVVCQLQCICHAGRNPSFQTFHRHVKRIDRSILIIFNHTWRSIVVRYHAHCN